MIMLLAAALSGDPFDENQSPSGIWYASIGSHIYQVIGPLKIRRVARVDRPRAVPMRVSQARRVERVRFGRAAEDTKNHAAQRRRRAHQSSRFGLA